jgi:hypothetical protein
MRRKMMSVIRRRIRRTGGEQLGVNGNVLYN